MLLASLVACDPCGNPPEVHDPDALLDVAALDGVRQTVADFYAWTGAGEDLCVGEVVIEDMGAWRVIVDTRAGEPIVVDPSAADSEWLLREGLCGLLDDARGLSAELGADIVETCAEGPERYDWADEVGAACGTTALGPVDAFVRDRVWIDAPPVRDYGHLGVARGETVRVDGLVGSDGRLGYGAVTGERLAIQTYRWKAQVGTYDHAVFVVDPFDGSLVATFPLADTAEAYGGPERAVFVLSDEDGRTLVTVDPDGETRSVAADDYFAQNGGVVSEGRLWTSAYTSEEQRPLHSVDLSSGEVERIDLPAAPQGLVALASGLAATADGVLLKVFDATVESDGDFTSIGLSDERFWTLAASTGEWTERGDLPFRGYGTTPDGVVIGRLYPAAGELHAAWDPQSDALWVSDDDCAGLSYGPGLVTGTTAWDAEDDDGVLVLTPYALTFE